MSEDLNLCLETAIKLAKEAGKMISEAITQDKTIDAKSSFADLVTETDRNVETFLITCFRNAFPHHKFIGEESASEGSQHVLTDDPTWIIDPVDGTLNFVHSFPQVAVSIGLAINKTVVVGVVFNPLLNRLFTACKGGGAHLNGKRIHVSKQTELSRSLLITELGNTRTPEFLKTSMDNFATLAPHIQGIRCMGSAALDMCSIACGEGEVYFEFGIHCWDMAASTLIVSEAGGTVIDTQGGPLDMMSRRVICAACPSLATAISGLIANLEMERD